MLTPPPPRRQSCPTRHHRTLLLLQFLLAELLFLELDTGFLDKEVIYRGFRVKDTSLQVKLHLLNVAAVGRQLLQKSVVWLHKLRSLRKVDRDFPHLSGHPRVHQHLPDGQPLCGIDNDQPAEKVSAF